MNIKSQIKIINRKIRYMFLTDAEKKMIAVSAKITQEYINSRKFRRIMDQCGFGKHITNLLEKWDMKPDKRNQSY